MMVDMFDWEEQVSLACGGPADAFGNCCGANAVLDVNDACCVGTLDARGGCCPRSSVVNACGVCGGPSTAVVSAAGQCCPNGLVDASGVCCDGVLDGFGVCDGFDHSGQQVLTLTVTLNGTADDIPPLSELLDVSSTGREDFDELLTTFVASALHRSNTAVSVQSISMPSSGGATSLRRLSRRQVSAGEATPVSVTVALAPYGGANDLSLSTLQSALVVPTSTGTSIASVDGAALAAVCGNGVCEAGERLSTSGVECITDCRLAVLSCPRAHGRVCNGVGACVVTASGDSVCVCSAAQGYVGDACAVCAVGYNDVGGGVCARLTVGLTATSADTVGTTVNTSSSRIPVMVIAAAAGAAVAAIAAAVVLVLVRRHRHSGRSRGKASGLGIFGLDKGDNVETVAIEADSTLRPVGALTAAGGETDAFFLQNDALFVERTKLPVEEARPAVIPVNIDVPAADGSAFLFQNELFKSAIAARAGVAAVAPPRLDAVPRMRLAKFSESYASQSFKRMMVAPGKRDRGARVDWSSKLGAKRVVDEDFSKV